MDGIINLHKPTGITSAKALYRVRALTGQRKSGHGGTLDPAASGVLLLCLGKATKLVERIMDQPKVYRATARLDVTSESFDCDRPLVPVALSRCRDRAPVNHYGDPAPVNQYRDPEPANQYRDPDVTNQYRDPDLTNQYRDRKGAGLSGEAQEGPLKHGSELGQHHAERSEASPNRDCTGGSPPPTKNEVLAALRHFEGQIQQIPPAISAVKIAGQPAYKRRAGDAPLDLKPRPVRIYWIHLHAFKWPMIDFEMCCSRGTYVRALIRDLGQHLGTGGCLTSLVRIRVGPFRLEEAWTMDAIAERTRKHLPLAGGGHGGGEDIRPAATFPPFLIPLDQSVRLLAPDAVHIPHRPE